MGKSRLGETQWVLLSGLMSLNMDTALKRTSEKSWLHPHSQRHVIWAAVGLMFSSEPIELNCSQRYCSQ